MKSIKLKLVAIYLALVFIVMILSGTFMLTSIKTQEVRKSLNNMQEFQKKLNQEVIQVTDPTGFQDVLSNYQNDYSKTQAYILNADGKTIAAKNYQNYDNSDLGLAQFKNASIISAVSGTAKDSIGKEADETGYKEWHNWATPVIKESDQTKYIIFIRTETGPMNERLLEIGQTFFLTVLLALILTSILGLLFANTLTVPISKLTKGAKEMAAGNLSQQIETYSNDEIGQLTESFNFMSGELDRFMSNMTSEKNKMEAILHNMTDGVLAYDSDETLLHANLACYDLLNLESEMNIENVNIEDIPFKIMMEKLGANIASLSYFSKEHLNDTTISTNDKFINVSFTSYEDKFGKTTGLVIVLQDITKHKKLDDMRKEFVANVSHEIRTPLTTVKSYTETLLEGAVEDLDVAREFLTVINSETDRMTLLTQDLLELSRFDNKQLSLDFQHVNLINILKQAIKQNKVLADKKHQQIVFDNSNTEFLVSGDPARINQVFSNIISNAIKYSDQFTKIVIYGEETDKYYRIYIKDAGFGIPKEDISRIFERFYRVDKTRSRQMGGTGLGLSIAKEIMEAHEGKIFIVSEQDKGTTMIMRFKKSFSGGVLAESAGEQNVD